MVDMLIGMKDFTIVPNELVQTHGLFTVDEPDTSWRLAAYNRITINFPRKYIFGSRLMPNISICTLLPNNHTNWNYGYIDNVASINNPHALSLNYTGDGGGWSEPFGEEATAENIKTHLEQLGFAICAPLATPITHQLTPQQLSTLKGQNNFWSNADYIEIEYELTETFDIQKAKRKIILNQPHVESVSGDLVTFDTDMRGKLKECKVYFSPVQEGEGDPSPDNVREITGWNGVTATRSGKNLVEVSAETRVYSNPTSNTKFTEDNNIIIITGSSNGGYRASCKPNTQYTYSCEPTLRSGGVYLRVWEEIGEEKNLIISQNVNSTKGAVATFTTGANVYSLIVGFYVYSTAAQTGLTISDFQLELGDTRTAYEPYQATTTSIDWTNDVGTVYGGYVDLVSGELVQTHWGFIADGENIKVNSRYAQDARDIFGAGIVYNTPTGIGSNNTSRPTNIYCNKIPVVTNEKIDIPYIYTPTAGALYMVFYVGKISEHPEITSKTDTLNFVNNWLQENPLQIIYELATPIHYQLTPQQLTTLRGTNNVYSNTNGQTEIKYWKH